MGDSAYSFSLTTFSRTGKLLQIEYALNAVANGRTSLGICAKDGVVIATDKKLTSELVDVAHVHKVELLTPSSGVCYSGVGPDYRVLGMSRDAQDLVGFANCFWMFLCSLCTWLPLFFLFHFHFNNYSAKSPKIIASLLDNIWRSTTCITTREGNRWSHARVYSKRWGQAVWYFTLGRWC